MFIETLVATRIAYWTVYVWPHAIPTQVAHGYVDLRVKAEAAMRVTSRDS